MSGHDWSKEVEMAKKIRDQREERAGAAIRLLVNESDRAVALIGAALIEAELDATLMRHLIVTNGRERHAKALLTYPGCLSGFAAKIDIAPVVGVCDLPFHTEMHKLRKIRNLFAHDMLISGFGDDKPKALIGGLGLIDRFVREDGDRIILDQPMPGGGIFRSVHPIEKFAEPRSRFLNTVIFTYSALWSGAPLGEHPVLHWRENIQPVH